jgi:hypothetical protein
MRAASKRCHAPTFGAASEACIATQQVANRSDPALAQQISTAAAAAAAVAAAAAEHKQQKLKPKGASDEAKHNRE